MRIDLIRRYPSLKSSVVFAALLLSACASKVAVHGKYIAPEQIKQIIISKHTKHDVEEILGTPLNKSTFDDNIWYYGGQKTSKTAFYKPVLIDYKGYSIEFNKSGHVTKITNLSQEDMTNVQPAQRYTPTAGHEMTILEQLGSYARRPAGKDTKAKRP